MKNCEKNDLCWCGSGLSYSKCHQGFDEKWNECRKKGYIVPPRNIIKNQGQVAKIRESAKINIHVLDYVAEHIKAGVTTGQIDQWVYQETVKYGGIPAPLH